MNDYKINKRSVFLVCFVFKLAMEYCLLHRLDNSISIIRSLTSFLKERLLLHTYISSEMDTIRCFICHIKTTAGKLLRAIRVQSVFFQLYKIDELGKPRAPTFFSR